MTSFATLIASCSDNSERNVIVEKSPFFVAEAEFDKSHADAVIEAVRSFSVQHNMDFLLARKSLPPGDFNASANSYYLNLKARHSEVMDKGVSISAIARGDPTPQDTALVEEFATLVRQGAAGKIEGR